MVFGPPDPSYTGIAVVGSWAAWSSAMALGPGTEAADPPGPAGASPKPAAVGATNPNGVRPAPAASMSPPRPVSVWAGLVSRETPSTYPLLRPAEPTVGSSPWGP